MSFEILMQQSVDFTLAKFPNATPFSSLNKLDEEIGEVSAGLYNQDPIEVLALEYADCVMCILDSAARAGIDPEKLMEAFAKKLQLNQTRKWVENPDHTYSHI